MINIEQFDPEIFTDSALFNPQTFVEELASAPSPIPIFKQTLAAGTDLLKQRFYANNSCHEAVPQRAWLMDQLLKQVWVLYGLDKLDNVSLIAVGGYGRQELHPASDVDILLLLEAEPNAELQEKLQSFLMLLWDIGLEVGHSVRTLTECQAAAKDDVTVMTNLIESRVLTGSDDLYARLQVLITAEHIWDIKDFFTAKKQEQEKRHLKYHDTAYNLEPNLKECPGGLRDIQTVAWVAKRHFNANTLYDLIEHGFLTEEEYETLIKCQDFLWSIRYMLHDMTGRHEDRIAFDYQRDLAENFGYEDENNHLGVENFMRRYYRTVKQIKSLNDILLQLFEEAIIYKGEQNIIPLSSRFQICNGFICLTNDNVFNESPYALLEIFLLMQKHNTISGIRASTARLLRASTHLIDAAFHQDLRARSLFFEIFREHTGLTRAMRLMSQYGVLSAYLPAFKNIEGQMQYDLFHVYTVDQHTLFVIRNLRRLSVSKFEHELPLCSKIHNELPKPELLYLAGLFHDIAKGRGGDHSDLGQQDALDFCKAHGISDHDGRFVAWLVKSHLLMSTTAQRKDTSDPDVINAFAQEVGKVKSLNYLYLLTVADIRGTSPKLWNGWKASLLLDLYNKTKKALEQGLATADDMTLQVKNTQAEARALLPQRDNHAVDVLWAAMNDEYFMRTTAIDIARETCAMLDKPKDQALVMVRKGFKGSTEFMIYTTENDALFVSTTHYLEQQQLNIVDAYIITTEIEHCTLLSYTVLESDGNQIQNTEREESIRQGLTDILSKEHLSLPPIKRLEARQNRHFQVPTRVVFNADLVNKHSIMEIVTTDRPGVLFRIAQALYACDVCLKNAKIGTFGTRVDDSFFITDKNRQAISSQDQLDCIQAQLSKRLDGEAEDKQEEIDILI